MHTIRNLILVLSLLPILIAGCTEQQVNPIGDNIDETVLNLRLPPQLEQAKSVNPKNIRLEFSVNGEQPQNVTQGETGWQVTVTIPPGEATTVLAYWYENFQLIRRLNLAKWEETIVVNTNTSVSIPFADYITTGDEFDADGDSVSNLEERNARSNPFDVLSTPDTIPAVDVIVPVFPDSEETRPIIDGFYEEDKYEGQNVQFDDTSGRSLFIDHLMIDEGTTGPVGGRDDGSTEMRWFAMHDRSFLYLFVLSENVNTSNPNGDSTDFLWNDDNLTIYLDGNNSKQSTYDGIDDIRIEIPMLDSQGNPNRSGQATSRVLVASSSPTGSTTLPPREVDVEFAVCECDPGDQHTWEIKIPMAQAGLDSRSSFGIDVQIDFDHDGGTRDVRWGWFHPSGFDSTWIDPSAMGTAYLQ